MTERFVWQSDKAGHGHIYDKRTGKRVSQRKKVLPLLNKLWDMVMQYEKVNQELIEENTRLEEYRDYLINIEKSYKDYYQKPITQAEWYGYIKRCYE